jgi:galactokinase
MDPVAARRAAHVIGENERVREGRDRLAQGQIREFGRLMFESHESSRANFENSCRELDAVVEAARGIPEIIGARLSGGGFGGSAVVLVASRDAKSASEAIARGYRESIGHPCEVQEIHPSDGARVVQSRRG